MRRNLAGPLCGLLFIALAVAGFAISGQGQDPTTQSADQIVSYWQDHRDANILSAFLVGGSAIPLLFFAGWIRQLLRVAEGDGGWLANVAQAGLVILAAGFTVGSTLHLALVDYVDDVDSGVTSALNAIDYDFFIPFAAGMSAFLLATGIVSLKSVALPKWLGWAAIVLGIACFTPAGFIAFLGGLVWILVVSMVGITRARGPAEPVAR